ncbi:MAG: hypothetical protein R2838_11670 [Caldilineaceae bacterium]
MTWPRDASGAARWSRAKEILEYTEIVRRDPYLTEDVRIDYLLAIDDLICRRRLRAKSSS